MNHHTTRPLFDQRGTNPSRLVGYECLEHGEIYTVAGNPSQATRLTSGGQYAAPPRVVNNKAHTRRLEAVQADG